MYALRDLMGHCYMHFAFVFTLSYCYYSHVYDCRLSERSVNARVVLRLFE